jgi:hypothetical protein
MGWHFRETSGINPFCIDQTVTVHFPHIDERQKQLAETFRAEVEARGGTAGFLYEEAPGEFRHRTGYDALLLSTENAME